MSRPDRKLRVGITLRVTSQAQSIWENGVFQNCVFLAQLLNASPHVEEAVLVNDQGLTPSDDMMLTQTGVRLVDLTEAMQTLDVMIEMSALLSEEFARDFRARGGRWVWMRVGNDYVIDIERAMFDRPPGALVSAKVYDAVWTLPEYEYSCTDYFAVTARAPVRIVPHLWTPFFFDQGVARLPRETPFGYQPGRPRWRVCSFEPNVCMVKTAVIPMLVCEEAYRAQPRFLESARFCNTLHMKDHVQFNYMARALDIVSHGLATFEGRFRTYEFLANYGDCIVSHHWENGQNYLYYEALYGGYPLVHNSEFIKGCGYYFAGFDAQAGGRALLRAFTEHDQRRDDERRSTSDLLRQLDTANADNVALYTHELLRLYDN